MNYSALMNTLEDALFHLFYVIEERLSASEKTHLEEAKDELSRLLEEFAFEAKKQSISSNYLFGK